MKGRKPALPPLRVHRDGPLPPAPEWLDVYGREFWVSVAPLLADFQQSDEVAFASLCQVWSMFRRAVDGYEKGVAAGAFVIGELDFTRAQAAVLAAKQAFDRGCGEFGLDPVARARLKVGSKNQEVDEFEAFLKTS